MTSRVAIGQLPFTADVATNVRAAAVLAREAASAGAAVLVLSELVLCGYRVNGLDAGRTVGLDDERLAPLTAAAGIDVLAGAAVRTRTGRVNGIVRFRAGHAPELVYEKVHLWAAEEHAFRAGRRLSVVTAGGLRIGLGVCYDAGFPELARAYAAHDVDLLAFSSAFLAGDEAARYDIYHAARALESGCYLVVSDALGDDGEDTFLGHSRAYGTHGEILADLAETPGIAVVDVDPGQVRRTRRALPYLVDRRPSYPVTEITPTNGEDRHADVHSH